LYYLALATIGLFKVIYHQLSLGNRQGTYLAHGVPRTIAFASTAAQKRKNKFFIENEFNPPPPTIRPSRAMRLTIECSRLPKPFSGHTKRSR
jgi:hypothetical protein